MVNADNEKIKAYIKEQIKKFAYREGDFTLSSGKKSSYYINCKEVTLRAETSLLIGHLLYSLIPYDAQAVGGLTLGADPLVSSVIMVSAMLKKPISGLIIRKKPKRHGVRASIEGPNIEPGSKITVLEDVTTTGYSALLAVDVLRNAGYSVTDVISLVDREQGASECFKKFGLDFQTLFRISEFKND